MLDNFQVSGPNGVHDCIVLEILGSSIQDLVETRFDCERLPGKIAKRAAKQALDGLDYLHKSKIGHGGMCTHHLIRKAIPESMQTYTRAISGLQSPICHS